MTDKIDDELQKFSFIYASADGEALLHASGKNLLVAASKLCEMTHGAAKAGDQFHYRRNDGSMLSYEFQVWPAGRAWICTKR